MKRLSIIGLSIIALGLSVSTSAQARGHKEVPIQPMTKISNNMLTRKYINPFNLVENAYQGAYRTRSIPGFGSLIDGSRMGKITAIDLVRAAIESEDLLPEMINDRDYISRVEIQLRIVRH